MDRLEPYSKRQAKENIQCAGYLASGSPSTGHLMEAQVHATLAVAWAIIYAGETIKEYS